MKSFLVLLACTYSLHAQHRMLYTNEKDGYAIEYPETWKRLDSFESQLSMVALAPEVSEAEDGVRERFNIALYSDETNVPGAFFVQYKTSHQEKHRSWKAIAEGEFMARKTTATFFSCYYADLKTKRTHGELVYVFKEDKKVVVLTCTTSFDELDRYKELFDQIARSFSFDPRPAE